MTNRFIPALFLSPLLASSASAADQHEVIQKLNGQRNYDSAAKKCEKWGAANASAASSLREACAQAEWDFARREGTVAGWSRYRARWAGTSFEAKALEQEANKALLDLGVKGSEDEYKGVAMKYEGTVASEDAWVKAAYAAFRTIDSADKAHTVVQRYPGHEDAANVTMKYLEAFITVNFDGGTYDIQLDPAAVVPDGQELTSNWVSRYADGSISSWAQEGRRQLTASGLTDAFIAEAAGQPPEGSPALPLCFNPSAPEGWSVGVMVTVGRGSAFKAAPFDKTCDQDTPPVFLTVADGKATGLSLGPGHNVQFPTAVGDGSFEWGFENAVELFVPAEPGTPVRVNDVIAQPLGTSIYMVHPIAGGLPWWWLTKKAPPGSLAFDDSLHASKLHGEWKVAGGAVGSVVTGPGLDKDQTWRLPSGEARALSPMVQKLTGLSAAAIPSEEGAVALVHPKKTPWTLPAPKPVLAAGETAPPAAAVVPKAGDDAAIYGPPGAMAASLVPVKTADLRSVVRPLTGAGVAVEPIRGWKLNFDGDAGEEILVEGKVGDKGVRFLLDPPDKGLNRVYAFDVMAADRLDADQDVPFAFKMGDITYLAIVAPRAPAGAKINAWHLGATTLEREYFEVASWTAP